MKIKNSFSGSKLSLSIILTLTFSLAPGIAVFAQTPSPTASPVSFWSRIGQNLNSSFNAIIGVFVPVPQERKELLKEVENVKKIDAERGGPPSLLIKTTDQKSAATSTIVKLKKITPAATKTPLVKPEKTPGQENTGVVFQNTEQFQSASCPAGSLLFDASGKPSPTNTIQVVVPAGTTYSTVSQIDADGQARALGTTQLSDTLHCGYSNDACSYTPALSCPAGMAPIGQTPTCSLEAGKIYARTHEEANLQCRQQVLSACANVAPQCTAISNINLNTTNTNTATPTPSQSTNATPTPAPIVTPRTTPTPIAVPTPTPTTVPPPTATPVTSAAATATPKPKPSISSTPTPSPSGHAQLFLPIVEQTTRSMVANIFEIWKLLVN